MRSRTGVVWGAVLATLGVLSLVAAAILVWAVVPGRAKLPADLDVTRDYEGTARVILNAQALAGGDPAGALVSNVPITIERTVAVLATDGDAAQVRDTRTLRGQGQDLARNEATYAVDRTSLEAIDDPPDGWTVTDHEGLTVSWPIGAEKTDYTGWVPDTQSTTVVRYAREEDKAGVNTYVYEATAGAAEIKDPQVLAALPQALPASALATLAQVLPIPAEVQTQLGRVLPGLTEPVPLIYTYEATSTYWVEPDTGTVIDVRREEIRRAGLRLPGGTTVPAVIPIYDVASQSTAESIQEAAGEAKDDRDALRLWGRTVPIVLLVLGIVLVIAGALVIWRAMRVRA